jgi:hypothetical protein
MKEREITNVSAGSQGEGSNREQASPTPCLRKKGGTTGDDDQEGLGWPPVNSHCVSSFLNTNPQQSHLFSVKLGAKSKKGRKKHEGKRYQTWLPAHKGRLKQRTSFPNPTPSQKGGNCRGRRSRRTRVATQGTRTAFRPSRTPIHNNPTSPPQSLGAKGRREENNTKETKIPRKEGSPTARRVDVR